MKIVVYKADAAPALPAPGRTIAKVQRNVRYLEDDENVEYRLWKVNLALAVYHAIESICYTVLTIVGIGTLVYSASTFLDRAL